MKHRVVITGLGVVSPIGTTESHFWAHCLADRGAVAPIPAAWRGYSHYKSGLWAPLPPLDYGPLNLTLAERSQRDPSAYLGLLAATEAVADAGLTRELVSAKNNSFRLPQVAPARAAVFIGTGVGGIHTFASLQAHHLLRRPREALERLGQHCDNTGRQDLQALAAGLRMPPQFNPFAVSMVMPNALSATIGMKFSLTGPNWTLSGACAAGTQAIGQAFEAIRNGRVDLALSGGVEYVGDEFGGVFRAFDASGVLVRDGGDPEHANRPFDTGHSGMLLAEGGAGVLVLEDLKRARERGARIYAEIAGYSETFDAYSLMIIEPSGQAILRAIDQALAMAGLAPADIHYLNAHGTGTRLNDEIEARLIAQVFGPRVLINSTKSLIGHTIGASGAIEAAVCALSLRDQTTHPCHNLSEPLADLNFARTTAPQRLRTALSQSFAFGGHNAVLVLRAWEET